MKTSKYVVTAANIERLRLYLCDNPHSTLKHAAEIIGVKPDCARNWKRLGYFKHSHAYEARKQQADAEAARLIKQTAPAPRLHRKTLAGVVAPPVAAAVPYDNSLEALIERGKTLKISEIRALVKANLVAQVSDAKAVSNFAAGLRALSGVQDVELEDIYESEQMIRIYVPQESPMPKDVLEVEPVEY